MKKIFITKRLYKTKEFSKKESAEVLDLLNIDSSITKIKRAKKKYKQIEIWGATKNKKKAKGTIFSVNDHINATGNNPLRGIQEKIEIKFPDMTNVYKKTTSGIITTSIGKNFLKENQEKYPTEYFCYATIMIRAFETRKINGFLVNI